MLSGKDAVEVSLVAAIDAALASYAQQGIEFDTDAVRRDVIEFFITRTKVMMRDAGNSIDAIDAVLSAGIQEPVELINRVSALEAARSEQPEVFEDLATAYARANNLCDSKLGTEVMRVFFLRLSKLWFVLFARPRAMLLAPLKTTITLLHCPSLPLCVNPSTCSSRTRWLWTKTRHCVKIAFVY